MSPPTKLTLVLLGASIQRETELPGYESLSDFASENYNLALASLEASVRNTSDLTNHFDVHRIDLDISQGTQTLGMDVVHHIVALEPDLVGLSCYCWSIDALVDVAEEIHQRANDVFLFAGGPSAGPVAKKLLLERPFISAVARGEGENTLIALLRARRNHQSLHTVQGLTWRASDGVLHENPDGEPVDLSTLLSAYQLGILRPPSTSMLLETSRGCPFQCRFCSCMGANRRLRYVPAHRVEEQLRWAVEHGIRGIKFADTAINFQTSRLRELTRAIHRADPHQTLRFTYFLKPERLTLEQIDLLAQIPSDEVIIGTESLTPAARALAGKPPFSPETFTEQLSWLQRVGPVTCSFILGLPGDSPEGLEQTLSWICEFDDNHPGYLHVICLFWLAVLPGSGLHARHNELGLRCSPRGTPYLLQSHEHSPDALLTMARQAIERHFAHPKLRVEHFHKEYLAQDAPAPDRTIPILRVEHDTRPTVLFVGELDESFRDFGVTPYHLRGAQLRAFLEKHNDIRQAYRFETALESENIVERFDNLHPQWLIASCLRLPPSPWLESLLTQQKIPRLLLEGASSLAQAEAWMTAIPSAYAATFGESEIALRALLRGQPAPGLVTRQPHGLVRSDSPQTLADLDDIPSPFQWGFIRRPGSTIAMQLGRPSPPRTWSDERIFRDMRWALEQRHTHVVWLDDSLPSDPSRLGTWIDTLRRADPQGSIRHSYRLDGTQSIACLKALRALPTHTLTVTATVDPLWLSEAEGIAHAWGQKIRNLSKSHLLSIDQLMRKLAPLRRSDALAGWSPGPWHTQDQNARLEFFWKRDTLVHIRLSTQDNRIEASFEVRGERPPEEQLDRLRRVITRLLSGKQIA